ncbi:hypothetical protein TNCV_3207561 [Trichonephila clavipes]|nr:hypothetical protein TNCV_3207561 [Trichonephila clavipes]
MEQEAAKGKGAFVQALWTQYAIHKLYFLVYNAWRRYGAQNLTTWTRLAQAVLDGCFGQKWPDCVFQVTDSCSICLSTMHWPEKTQCGHAFHLRCLLRHLDSLKDLTHAMILIPAKMNSPDYDDFIDMFSVPTPVSPLPPTPVASPSHEASEDVIYDSLPPWSNLSFLRHL